MHSGATLNSPQVAAAPSRLPTPPLVFVDGLPRPDLAVLDIECEGRLDERRAELIFDTAAPSLDPERAAALRQLAGRSVTVASPIALEGGASRLRVELVGRIDRIQDETLSAGDDWSGQLDAPSAAHGDGSLTVAGLFAADGPLASTELSIELLEPAIRAATVPASVRSAATVRVALETLCDTFALTVDRHARWVGTGAVESRSTLERSSIGVTRQLALRRGEVSVRAWPVLMPPRIEVDGAGIVFGFGFGLGRCGGEGPIEPMPLGLRAIWAMKREESRDGAEPRADGWKGERQLTP